MAWRWLLLVSLLGGPSHLCAQARAVSPDHRWKIEITKETHTDPVTGIDSTPHVRFIMHDLLAKKDQIVWDKTDWWLPGPEDSSTAIWRADSRAFTLHDTARRWDGFSVYVLGPHKWVQAYQSNYFLDKIPQIWNLKDEEFDAVQEGGVVTDLEWGDGGTLHFRFWSFDKTDTLITEKVINENGNPEVIYVAGTQDKSAVPPLVAKREEKAATNADEIFAPSAKVSPGAEPIFAQRLKAWRSK